MKRFIYMIEVQKPTGTHRFLKSFSEPIQVEGEYIDEYNKFKNVIYYDRIENFSYIGVITAETDSELLDIYYSLVKKYKESLQYTENNYVYLIPKKYKNKGVPIAHKLPRLPLYDRDRKKPIPFYPEKDMEEYSGGDSKEKTKYSDFCQDKWFRKFFETLNELMWFNCYHSYNYLVFEAFLLTYGKYYGESLKDKNKVAETLYYHYQLRDEPCSISKIGTEWVSPINLMSYDYYISPTLEGKVFCLPVGEFYSTLMIGQLYECYYEFCSAAEQWRASEK